MEILFHVNINNFSMLLNDNFTYILFSLFILEYLKYAMCHEAHLEYYLNH